MTGAERIVETLAGMILTPDEADRIIAVTHARTRARVQADNRVGLEERLLDTMRLNSAADPNYAVQAVPILLAEINRLKGKA